MQTKPKIQINSVLAFLGEVADGGQDASAPQYVTTLLFSKPKDQPPDTPTSQLVHVTPLLVEGIDR